MKNNSITLDLPRTKKLNFTKAWQKAKDIITFKPLRDLFYMDFTFELTEEDLKEIHEELYP